MVVFAGRRRTHGTVDPIRVGTAEPGGVLDVKLTDQVGDQVRVLGDQLGALDWHHPDT
jgi:hypothetical protein